MRALASGIFAIALVHFNCETARADLSELPSFCGKLVQTPPPAPHCYVKESRSCTNNSRTVSAVYDYFYATPGDKTSSSGNAASAAAFTHKTEFVEMTKTGIGFALIRYEPTVKLLTTYDGSSEESWQYSGLNFVVQGYHDAYCGSTTTPPALGLYLETQQFGLGETVSGLNINLQSERGKELLYQAIASFYCRVPKNLWARIDDKPVVFLGSLDSSNGIPLDIFDFLQTKFEEDFDTSLYIVKNREKLVAAVDPEAAQMAQELRTGTLTFEEAEQRILGSDSFYHKSGDNPDSYLELLYWKIFFEKTKFPIFSVKVGDVVLPKERAKFLKRLFESRHGKQIWAIWVSLWIKLYREDPRQWDEIRKELLRGFDKDSFWLNVLARGTHQDMLRKELIASAEFFREAGNSPLVFIHNLFETITHTCATPEALEKWQAYLERKGINVQSGNSFNRELRGEMAAQFLAQAAQSDVALLFAYLTDRYPGWSGFSDSSFNAKGQSCAEFRNVSSFGPLMLANNIEQSMSFYEATWKKISEMRPPPPLVVLLAWNNFHDADHAVRKIKFGDDFTETTKKYAALYKGDGDFVSVDRCP